MIDIGLRAREPKPWGGARSQGKGRRPLFLSAPHHDGTAVEGEAHLLVLPSSSHPSSTHSNTDLTGLNSLSSSPTSAAMDRDPTEVDERDPCTTTLLQHMIAGSFAGVSEHSLMFPVDTVKTMVQAGGGRGARPGEPFAAGGTSARMAVVRELVAKNGLGVLWRGVGVVPVGCIPAHAMMFSVYEIILEAGGSRQQAATPERVAAVGAAAGGVATLFHDAVMVRPCPIYPPIAPPPSLPTPTSQLTAST